MGHRAGEGTLGAQPRAFEERLPVGQRCVGAWDGEIALEAFAVRQDEGVAADRNRDLGKPAARIDADRRARRIGVGGRAVRLFDLKELQVKPATSNVERLAAAATALL